MRAAIFEAPAAHESWSGEQEWSGESWGEAWGESWGEADPFIGGLAKGLLRKALPIARTLAPVAARAVAGMVPGGVLLGGALGALLREADAEVSAMEASLEAGPSFETSTGLRSDALLSEVLAAQAAEASTDAEAATILAGSLPITIAVMRGGSAVRPVVPVLAQATSRLVRVLGSSGPAGRQLVRTVPAIQRRAVRTLTLAARQGRPVTPALATRAVARAASSVLGNPRLVSAALRRTAVAGASIPSTAGGCRCGCKHTPR